MIFDMIFLQNWISWSDLPPVFKPQWTFSLGDLQLGSYRVFTPGTACVVSGGLFFFFFQPAIISPIVWQFPKQKVFNFFFRLRCFILTTSIRLLVLAFSGAGTLNRLNKILTSCLVHDANELYQLQNFQHHKNRQHCWLAFLDFPLKAHHDHALPTASLNIHLCHTPKHSAC